MPASPKVECPECGKSFANLDKHMAQHAPDRGPGPDQAQTAWSKRRDVPPPDDEVTS